MVKHDSQESPDSSGRLVPSSNRRPALLIFGLLVLAWCWFWLAPEESHSAPPVSERSAIAVSNGSASEQESASVVIPTSIVPSVQRLEVTAKAIVLRVRDGAGSPVEGATVSRCSAIGARNLSRSDQIGITDRLGELSIPLGQSRAAEEADRLAISAKGLVRASIDYPRESGRYEVMLASGNSLEVQCRDFVGRSIPGIRVAISMVLFPASLWVDVPSEQREPGSDAVSTTWHGESDNLGTVLFDGLLPGQYFVRAESRDYLMASTDSNQMTLDVPVGGSRHVIVCGQICVAALQTTVPLPEVLFCEITGCPKHIVAGFAQEALELRRREIESKFPECRAILSLTRGDDASQGLATFRYSTLGHGELVREVPFIPIASFVKPEVLVAMEGHRIPAGEVCVRLVGDFGVSRGKLRVTLRRRARDQDGILCVEDQARLVPAASYVVDFNDREMAKAIDKASPVEVRQGEVTEIVLKIKDGLVPLAVQVEMPAVLNGQFASLVVSGLGQIRRGRTRGGAWLTWVAEGIYEVTAETPGCNPVSARVVVSRGKVALVPLTCELIK